MYSTVVLFILWDNMLSVDQKKKWVEAYQTLTCWEKTELISLLINSDRPSDDELKQYLRDMVDKCGYEVQDLLSQEEMQKLCEDDEVAEGVLDSMSHSDLMSELKSRSDIDLDDIYDLYEDDCSFASKYNLKKLIEFHSLTKEKILAMAEDMFSDEVKEAFGAIIPGDLKERLKTLL